MLHNYALYSQLDDVLPFVLHIGSGLSDKRFSRYSHYGFDYQIIQKTILKVYNPYIGEFTNMVNSFVT